MTCADCVHYRRIGHTYGNCELVDNQVVKFDEDCKAFYRMDNRAHKEKEKSVCQEA